MTSKPMWKEGLFMMPQHLQLMDRHHEQLLNSRVSSLGENTWGVAELEVDQDQLARGIFRLRSCVAVMPDGVVVEVGQDQPLEGLVAMTEQGLAGGQQAVEVLLAVPAADVGGAAPEEQASAGVRYLHRVERVSDQYGVAPVAEVDCVRPNAQLLMGHQDHQNYVTLKLAELVPDPSGQLALNPRYVPPCLRVAVSERLSGDLTRLVAALGAKQKELSAKYGGRAASIVEFGAADLSTFFFLHTVNSWLPVFMHHAERGNVHPEQLYLSLAAMAGHLSSFDAGKDPLQLPRFRYTDLGNTLVPLMELVFQLLGTVVSERYQTISLQQTQPGLFVGQVEDPNLLRNNNLYLVAGGDLPDNTLREELPRFVKVGSIDQIANIVHSALPGVGLRIDFSPPSALPVRAHMVYFQVDKQGRYWDSVLQSGTIAIYQPVEPERVKLELMAVLGK